MPQLILLTGSEPGKSYELKVATDVVRVGRGPECELRVADQQTSRVHAEVRLEGNEWHIRDCESLNGTLVNSSPLQRSVLSSGDLIRIGETILMFCHDDSAAGLQAAVLGDETRVRRILGAEKRRIADDPIGSDSTSGPIRKLACLYRLSKQIYMAGTIDGLLRYAVASIQQVLGAREARICLRGNTGKFRVFATGDQELETAAANVLASWVVEKDEALLLDMNENVSWRGPDDSIEKGTCLAVPVPGRERPLGAIECFQPEDDRAFDVPDLEFLISVGQHIGLAIENLTQRERIQASNENLKARLGQTQVNFIGECSQLRELRTQIARVAQTDVTVLVLGESGTGKEVVAQTIHELSLRTDGPLVTVNCASFSEALLESELFGHEKGAFTGADKRRKGKFELAHGGTIFLDEVGELSESCQAKLLRLLEGQAFQRVGGSESIEVDVRIVAATNRDLAKMVRARSFRQDLWYRLRVVELVTPPLRERGEDVLELAEHFLNEFKERRGDPSLRLSPDAVTAIQSHQWPGNVREMRNAMERAAVLVTGSEILAADLGLSSAHHVAEEKSSLLSLAELEQQHIESVLTETGGNKTKACEILGITRAALYNKLNRMNAAMAD
ncbi:MAG: sigma 54-interacting transcriptional regulator [Planctomycetota bacterium]